MGNVKKKKAAAKESPAVEGEEKPKRTIVRVKDRSAWAALLKAAKDEGWRKLRVEVEVRGMLLAGKPANLDAANAMLKARGLEDMIALPEDITDPVERERAAASIAKDEGLCEFVRREGKTGLWIPSNNIKAGIKENWSVLGLRVSSRGSRGALAEGIFVVGEGEGEDKDWVCVSEKPEPDGVHKAVAHMTGAQGPVSSIKRHEFVKSPRLVFYMIIATAAAVADKVSDDELAKCFEHFTEHGMGACRSQGHGKFDVLSIEEVERGSGDAEAAAAA